MHYIGLGKRPAAAPERSALHYVGLGKRKSALNYIGLGRKRSADQQRYDYANGAKRHVRRATRGARRRVKLGRRWASSTVDPALLMMGIGRK